MRTPEKNRAEFKALYDRGWSLSAIAKHFGYSKTKVRSHLQREGVALRNFARFQRKMHEKPSVMYSGATPYGYAFLEGKLLKDPREYQIVLEMYQMWIAGRSYRAIARVLNRREIPTRHSKKWNHEVIKKIIDRHKNGLQKP